LTGDISTPDGSHVTTLKNTPGAYTKSRPMRRAVCRVEPPCPAATYRGAGTLQLPKPCGRVYSFPRVDFSSACRRLSRRHGPFGDNCYHRWQCRV